TCLHGQGRTPPNSSSPTRRRAREVRSPATKLRQRTRPRSTTPMHYGMSVARCSGWLSIRFGEYASRAVEHRGPASLLGVTHKQRGLHAVCGLQRGQDTTDVSFDRALPHTEFLRNL